MCHFSGGYQTATQQLGNEAGFFADGIFVKIFCGFLCPACRQPPWPAPNQAGWCWMVSRGMQCADWRRQVQPCCRNSAMCDSGPHHRWLRRGSKSKCVNCCFCKISNYFFNLIMREMQFLPGLFQIVVGFSPPRARRCPVRGVVPGNAALMLWGVVVSGFVEKFGSFREHQKAMCQARRYP